MQRFILGQSGDFYSSHSGLALVGLCMNRYINLAKMVGREEGLSRTYHKTDGYAPNAAYLGLEGWHLEIELRPGGQGLCRGSGGRAPQR